MNAEPKEFLVDVLKEVRKLKKKKWKGAVGRIPKILHNYNPDRRSRRTKEDTTLFCILCIHDVYI